MPEVRDPRPVHPDLSACEQEPGPNDMPRACAPQRVLLVEADPALAGLLDEWLADCGCAIELWQPDRGGGQFQLIVADVPFPRQTGLDALKRVMQQHPATPVLALSSNFFAGVQSSGAVARSLGVASVLAKPVTRQALLAEVRRLLSQTQ